MGFRVITKKEVQQILSVDKCIELVETAHKELHEGNAYQPLRTAMLPKQAKGILATMPAYLGGEYESMGLKAVTVFPGNHQFGLDSHQGAIILINPDNGTLQAVIDAAEITALRTAAASAVATKYLAKTGATSLSLLGTGVQAHSHLRALNEIMAVDEVTVWNRTKSKAEDFVNQYKEDFSIKLANTIVDTLHSDVICTLTAASQPLFDYGDVKQGTHINAVGASQPNGRELGSGFAKHATWFTDVYESVKNEAGALLIPLLQGEILGLPHVIELGEVITTPSSRRQSDDEVTVYKSLGVGIQDLVSAKYVLNQAELNDLGQLIDF